MSVTISLKLISLSYVRHRNERKIIIIDDFFVKMINVNEK